MKRVIKFRAYTEISNEVLGIKYDVPHNYNDTVMQFTGLLDRHGKEIYEGDIVEYGGTDRGWVSSLYSGKFEVRANLISGIELVGFFDQQYTKLDDFFNQFEVIGNIYENPELLNT